MGTNRELPRREGAIREKLNYPYMNLRIDGVSGRGAPERALKLACSGQWGDGELAYLLALDGRLLFGGQVVSEFARPSRVHWTNGSKALLKRDESLGIELVAPLSSSAIAFIESRRDGNDVGFELEFRCQWQEAKRSVNDATVTGAVFCDIGVAQMRPISRSDWLVRLREMQWSEIQLFEVAVEPFTEDAQLAESLRLLREAEDALRTGDYKGVLGRCREAFESAAKYAARSNDLRQGFTSLLAAAFPENDNKSQALDEFIKAFSGYAHLGRHAQYPALHISKSEAHFVLTTALGFFSLLSRRLSKTDNAGI